MIDWLTAMDRPESATSHEIAAESARCRRWLIHLATVVTGAGLLGVVSLLQRRAASNK